MKRMKARGGFTLVELLVSITILGIIGVMFATMFAGAGNIFRESVQEERVTQEAALVLDDVAAGGDVGLARVDMVKEGQAGASYTDRLNLLFLVDGVPYALTVNGDYYDATVVDAGAGTAEPVLRVFSPDPAKGLP
jgi:prepilin-type N-terminal cleavage/methylation domain-containing protein